MFETRPDFEQWVPPAIATDGSRYWQAIALSSNLPWYLLRHRVEIDEDGSFVTQTTAIAWESTLRGVLEHLDRESVVGLCLLELNHEGGDWTLRHVTEVWLASAEEQSDTGPLLFRVRDVPLLLSTHLEPVERSNACRTLLVRLP